jgi:opacity protein-like surface antigen
LKRTLPILIVAALSAVLLSPAAICQTSPDSGSNATDQPERTYNYEVYAGYAYTSLNQVNQSRFGLQGVNVSVTRYWGRYFGLTAEGDDYTAAISTPVVLGSNITPSISSVFLGPVLHANIYGHVGGFFHGLLGGEHTGGEKQTPNISFAGGVGGGLEYSLSPRLAIRASGDYIGASFSTSGNSAELGNSPHKSWDSRASIGVVYKF